MTRLQSAERTVGNADVYLPAMQETPHARRQIDELLDEVVQTIAPVWPLKDYVAVNPYAGVSERRFLDGRAYLRLFSKCETLMPLSYYADEFTNGQIVHANIETAINELGLQQSMSVDAIVDAMHNAAEEAVEEHHRPIQTMAERVRMFSERDWSGVICDEISKFCAAHYDDGQAIWRSPWRHLPLFQAWRSAALIDRNVEVLGLHDFRDFVDAMPHAADTAIVWLFERMGVPQKLWKPMLLCEAYTIPGWSAWAKYQTSWTDDANAEQNDLVGLLAIRLAYDVALSEALGVQVDWESVCRNESSSFAETKDDAVIRHILLHASEAAFRDGLLGSLTSVPTDQDVQDRKLAQLVFCIDVRSERMRRNLEEQSGEIETFGFAGFFGMPIESVPIGSKCGNSHVPVLLKPQFQLHEGLHETETSCESAAVQQRAEIRSWRTLWKSFQSSAVGCFSFVETTGLLYGWKLFAKASGLFDSSKNVKYDGISQSERDHLGPTLRGLNCQGITTSHQVDLVESMLTNLGLTDNFARLVVLCGHASQTDNNPLAAGLDCGACGGHSGEPNARVAAMLVNQSYVRSALAKRGIEIPEDTYFLGGLHNTTTDRVEFFELDEVPESHLADVKQLISHATIASKQTALERMPIVASNSLTDLMRRSIDWSEVRPEWGLSGNAAFVAGPRSMTKNANLDGRAFLHSYDYLADPDGKVLETIMTAPLVVSHWINMQYYASTVDNDHFGSGNKTVHNVVGRFGILSGNGGDLTTVLPWQSLHTGERLQHAPVRLQAVIAAPRESIDRVVQKHELLGNLLNNGWLHLVAVDDGVDYRYADGTWVKLSTR